MPAGAGRRSLSEHGNPRGNGPRLFLLSRKLTGLSIATIYTRYDSGVTDTAHNLAQHERDNFGKKQDYGMLFTDKEAWDITYRGARPLPDDRFARYKETTLRDMFYIIRVRLHEPGWIIESKGADVIENRPVEIVDLTDADNRTTTVYFDQITKLPVRQVFFRRDPVTKDRNEEVTHFTKYREPATASSGPSPSSATATARRSTRFFRLRWRSTTRRSPTICSCCLPPSSC